MAFDFGLKRIGVATGHEQTGVASPLTTLQIHQASPDWDAIGRLISEWQPDALIVGVPYHMDGTDSDMSAAAQRFGRQLHGRFRKTAKGDIDMLAASLILQTWLQQQETLSDG